jgi:hypothetical protein
MLRSPQVLGGDVALSPEEVILRAFVDGTPREQLIDRLAAFPYTFGEYAPYPHEGKFPGTWDQVQQACVAGFLTMEEYLRVHDTVQPPPAQ